MKYYIISPHSLCDNNKKGRHCDRVAKFYAESIYKILIDKGHDVILRLSDQLRFGNCQNDKHKDELFRCDYNRDTTLELPWREKFGDEIKVFRPNFIFEIHSYPGEMENYFHLWKDFKLKCLKSSSNTPFIAQLVENLGDVEGLVGIASPNFQPSITKQIETINKEINDNIPHTLFEFNEKFKDADLAIRVADAIVEMFGDEKKTVYGGDVLNQMRTKTLICILIALILLLLILIVYNIILTIQCSNNDDSFVSTH